MMIPIKETFISIQGEGIKAGLRTLFIRVAGCNFAQDNHPCSYCDTPYAWSSDNAKTFTVEQIKENVKAIVTRTGVKEICLTGGEPLLYSPEINEVIYWLSKLYSLSVETNGSYPITRMDGCWSLDIKCPSSGNEKYNNYDNLKSLNQKDQVKFVIGDRQDFDFAKEVIKSKVVLTNVIFQPVWRVLPLPRLFEWMIQDRELQRVRIGTQLQKIAYPRRKRGI